MSQIDSETLHNMPKLQTLTLVTLAAAPKLAAQPTGVAVLFHRLAVTTRTTTATVRFL
jgi:hypothetical protein